MELHKDYLVEIFGDVEKQLHYVTLGYLPMVGFTVSPETQPKFDPEFSFAVDSQIDPDLQQKLEPSSVSKENKPAQWIKI